MENAAFMCTMYSQSNIRSDDLKEKKKKMISNKTYTLT